MRRCFMYDDEYSDCTSIKARLNQLFIFGKTLDCSQWKRDSVNCYKWTDEHDCDAAVCILSILLLKLKIFLYKHSLKGNVPRCFDP